MGKVYLVGAGPGSADLLTRKALRLLEQATVVIYDRLVSDEILECANPNALLLYAGKHFGQQEEIQQEIHSLMVRHAKPGAIVVRLKGGDPMVFGRGAEEWRYLTEQGIDCEVVPGVSSAIAVPALAGIPLTCRGVAGSFAVVAGHRQHLQSPDWARYRDIDTLVILMGIEFRDIIATTLIDLGRPATQPVAFIERGSTRRERVIVSTLEEVARGAVQVDAPAVFVIGEVVRMREQLQQHLREACLAG
ncbi:MAG: uroporphyrinogen-III C-methyltransferase [Bryobacterales bacterium]|nr:uroporphyrinogen-III C-methyltransferase [Bryobacterales bacterium]